MKNTSYTGKNREDLLRALGEKRKAMTDFHFGTAGSKARNVKEGKNLKKEVARILTELNK